MERDVDGAERGSTPLRSATSVAQPAGERDAARVDADEREASRVVVALDQLVREPRERPRQGVRVEDLARAFVGAVSRSSPLAPFRPRWTGLKGRVRV